MGHRPHAWIWTLDSQEQSPVAIFRYITISALKLYRKKSCEKSGICREDKNLWKCKERIILGHKSRRNNPFSDFEVGVIGLPAKDLLSKCNSSLTFVRALLRALVIFLYHRSVGTHQLCFKLLQHFSLRLQFKFLCALMKKIKSNV